MFPGQNGKNNITSPHCGLAFLADLSVMHWVRIPCFRSDTRLIEEYIPAFFVSIRHRTKSAPPLRRFRKLNNRKNHYKQTNGFCQLCKIVSLVINVRKGLRNLIVIITVSDMKLFIRLWKVHPVFPRVLKIY